jgi:murein DD-endopeptidase MepM/ murein hydrolase activator NlpD
MQRNIVLATFLVLSFTAAVFFLDFPLLPKAAAQSVADANAQIAKLEAEIAKYKDELVRTQNQTSTLAGAVKELDLNQKKLDADVRLIEEKIKKTNLELGRLGNEIDDTQDSIKGLRTAVIDGARRLHEGDQTSFLIYLMREESMTSAWREFDAIRTIESHLNENIHKLASTKTVLEVKKTDTEAEKNEILKLKKDLDTQKKILQANKNEKERLLRDTKNDEASYKKMIADSEKKKEAFESELRNVEEGLKFTVIVKDLPTGVAFAWPLEKFVITQKFGVTASSGRLYKSGTHNGVDFGVPIGTPVYAMADGIVEGTGDTDVLCPRVSFGRFVLIKYDNGLASTYGHLSVVSTSIGTRVKKGQLVGYSGNTGYSTGPHLHVSVYAKESVNLKTLPSISCKGKVLTQPIAAVNGYLDPLKYLPAR